MPKGAVAGWLNGRLGDAVVQVMNARRAVAHLARVAPELVQVGVEAGLARHPIVWKRLATLGAQLPARKGKTTMQTTTKPAGEAGAARAAPADEAVVRGQLEVMMRDPRYWDNARREPAFVRKVEDGFRKLYGGQP